MAKSKMKLPQKVSIGVEFKITCNFETLTSDGSIASFAVSEADERNLNDPSKKVSIKLDEKTAKELTKLVSNGIVGALSVATAGTFTNNLNNKK